MTARLLVDLTPEEIMSTISPKHAEYLLRLALSFERNGGDEGEGQSQGHGTTSTRKREVRGQDAYLAEALNFTMGVEEEGGGEGKGEGEGEGEGEGDGRDDKGNSPELETGVRSLRNRCISAAQTSYREVFGGADGTVESGRCTCWVVLLACQ